MSSSYLTSALEPSESASSQGCTKSRESRERLSSLPAARVSCSLPVRDPRPRSGSRRTGRWQCVCGSANDAQLRAIRGMVLWTAHESACTVDRAIGNPLAPSFFSLSAKLPTEACHYVKRTCQPSPRCSSRSWIRCVRSRLTAPKPAMTTPFYPSFSRKWSRSLSSTSVYM